MGDTHYSTYLMSSDALFRTVSFAEACGVSSEPLLERAGVPLWTASKRDALVSHAAHYRFVEFVCDALGTEHAALDFFERETLADTTQIGVPMVETRSVKDFFIVASRLKRVKQTAVSYRLEVKGGTARLYIPKSFSPSVATHSEDLASFGLVIKHLRRVLGANWSPTTVNFEYAAREPLPENGFFGNSKVHFNHGPSYMEFPAHLLGAPIRKLKPLASRYSVEPQILMDSIPDSLIDATQMQIRTLMHGNAINIEVVARSLGVSSRTLQRRLMAQGTSFRTLVSDIRFGTACDLLADTDMKIEEIAFDLGYSDAPNFTRSFRSRAGLPPKRFRRSLGNS